MPSVAARLRREARVRHDRRVLGERLDAAEALGAREDARARCRNARRPRRGRPSSSKLIIPPGRFICRARERVPRVRRRGPGSGRARPAGASRASRRSPRALCDVLPHAHAERLQAAQHEVAVERARHAADRLLEEVELLGERVVARHDRAADDVGVAVQVLRRRVHDDRRAELERPLEHRRRERVVDGERDAARRARSRRWRRCRRS